MLDDVLGDHAAVVEFGVVGVVVERVATYVGDDVEYVDVGWVCDVVAVFDDVAYPLCWSADGADVGVVGVVVW